MKSLVWFLIISWLWFDWILFYHFQAALIPTTKLFKILFIGSSSTGKTSLIRRYVKQTFAPSYRATIGADFLAKVVEWDQKLTLRLQLWDIAGQSTYILYTRGHGKLRLSRWNEDKLKMYEFMNIFPILTGIPQKSCKRSFFIFTEQTFKKAFMFWTGVVRQMH